MIDIFRRFRKSVDIVLVDVDGTVSPSQYGNLAGDYYFSSWNGGHYFSSLLRADLEALPAEKMWLTGWGVEAEDVFQCGWKTVTGVNNYSQWKLDAVLDLESRMNVRRIVWFDDEHDLWSARFSEVQSELLPISTDFRIGLGPEELSRARAFLESS